MRHRAPLLPNHSWINDATWAESETIGTFSFRWADQNCLYQIECDEGFSCNDLLHELAILEAKALGYVKHGQEGSAHAT